MSGSSPAAQDGAGHAPATKKPLRAGTKKPGPPKAQPATPARAAKSAPSKPSRKPAVTATTTATPAQTKDRKPKAALPEAPPTRPGKGKAPETPAAVAVPDTSPPPAKRGKAKAVRTTAPKKVTVPVVRRARAGIRAAVDKPSKAKTRAASGSPAKSAASSIRLVTPPLPGMLRPRVRPPAAPPPLPTHAPQAAPTERRPDNAFRLADCCAPTSYHVHLIPDLNRGLFRGEVLIELDVFRPTAIVEFHAVDLTIDRAVIAPRAPQSHVPSALPRHSPTTIERPNQPIAAAAITPRPTRETVELRFAQKLMPGRWALMLAFGGELKKHLRGFYRATSGNHRYAFSQFEAADARRCFPCFDEPAFKARFTFSVTVRAGLQVLSNNPLRTSDHNANGTTTWHFTQTPLLSTYLCAIAVGEFESGEQRHVGKVPIRVWHVPGKSHLASFALDAAVAALQRLERYFGIAYPYEKLDLVAVPDFEAGAMENAGAVFFRETLLLADADTITVAEKKRIAEVVAHELAHMWFGNLVTMRGWDDLWLNESFATWMAFKVVDDWQPEWRMWNSFEPHRAQAFGLDAMANTHPIYAKVRNAGEATENFDAITYEKGCAVVRMIEAYLGEKRFGDGVRRYIARHREGNATAADLWKALEEASGQPVSKIVRPWVEQPGFPLVKFHVDANHTLEVQQSRFLASPTTKPGPTEQDATWPIPLVVRIDGANKPRTERSLLGRTQDRVARLRGEGPHWYYGNADEGGFYRVLHDPACFAEILRDPARRLSPAERIGLIGHQWAVVRAGHAQLSTLLDLVESLRDERDWEVLQTLTSPLAFIDDQIAERGNGTRAALAAWIRRLFGPAWAGLGWEERRGDNENDNLSRAALLSLVGTIAEDPGITRESAPRFDQILVDRTSVEPNLLDALVQIAAREGDWERFGRMRAAVNSAETPQERRRFQLALGDFRDPRSYEQALALSLTAEIPTQDVGFLLIRLMANPAARERTWGFIREQWAKLAGRLPPFMLARLIEATSQLKTRDHRKEVAAFFREHPVETAARALKLALERFEINDELRTRTGPQLAAWLAARAN